MRSVRASRCRRRVRWIAFRSGTDVRPMIAEPFATDRGAVARRALRVMVPARVHAVPEARRDRARHQRGNRVCPDATEKACAAQRKPVPAIPGRNPGGGPGANIAICPSSSRILGSGDRPAARRSQAPT